MNTLKIFALQIVLFIALDFLWLGVIMKDFYNRELGELARRNGDSLAPRWAAAIPIYFLVPAGIIFLIRSHLLPDTNILQAFGWGALFGLITYGVYDLTNLAILEKWTLRMTIADMAWGSFVCGLLSIALLFFDHYQRPTQP